MTDTSIRRRRSLRRNLPLLISALIAVVLASFLWMAYQAVRRTLVEAAGGRAREVANQVSTMLTQSSQQRRNEILRIAGDPAVRRYLLHPGEDPAAARARLATLAQPNGSQRIELWNGAGECVLTFAIPPEADATVPVGSRPSASDAKPLRVYGNVMFAEVFVPVQGEPSAAVGSSSADASDGFLMLRRTLTVTGSDQVNRLIGSGVAIQIGNKAGDVWTDLEARQLPPPAVDLSKTGVPQYRVANGERRIGVLADTRDTPLAVWLDFPEATVLAPARRVLERMVLIAVVVVAIAAALTGVMSARITTPLHELTEASEAIAAGEFSRRVASDRRDELGRLGAAFNAMTGQIAAMHRDLEDRVQQRTASLNETRAELDRFFSLSLDMLCIKDMDGRFRRVNPAWQRTLGWSIEALTSSPIAQFVHPDDLASTTSELAKLAHGEATVSFENRYQCADGSYRWLSWNAAGLPERGLIYAAVRDVTEQKLTAQELHDRVTELGVLNEELEAFSYSVSHDLRAPLRHVTGFAGLLQQQSGGALDDRGRRYVTTIVDAAARMGRLIDDLLMFSRIGRASLATRPVDLGELVREAQREASGDVNGRDIVWKVAALPVVEGDRALLGLVVTNLLSNALKYTSTRPRAEIEVGVNGQEPGQVAIFVRDNGVGFDPQYGHKLFGVFQRLHTAEEFDGTGIGLANVRRIIHRHGGRTWAEGVVDAGATFYFSLPVKEDHA